MKAATLPHAPLPLLESTLYIVVWLLIAFKLVFSLYETSRDYADHSDINYMLIPGWSFLGREQDTMDYEWDFWSGIILGVFGKWMIGHVVLGQLLRFGDLFKIRKYFFLVYSLSFYIFVIGTGPLLLLLIECFIIYLLVWFTANTVLIWIISLTFLLVLNFEQTREPLFSLGLLQKGAFHQYYFQEYTLCLAVLHFVSFSLCNCDSMRLASRAPDSALKNLNSEKTSLPKATLEEESNNKQSEFKPIWSNPLLGIVDLLFYVFYLPLCVAGPMMNYDVFYRQFHQPLQPWSVERLKPILKGFCRVLFWGFAYDFLRHYLYGGALINKPTLLAVLPLWSIAGTGYTYGMFFVVRYVVIWGFCGVIGHLDQLDPPGIPSCGSRIYQYSKMWKTFDRGLYAFLKQHVYIWLGGSRHGMLMQITALLACFTFIAVWHGLHAYIILWCIVNFITIMFERIAGHVANIPVVKEFEARYFSPTMVRRLHALLIVPCLMASTLSLSAFFAGYETGSVISYRLLIEGFPVSTIVFMVTFYCVVQTGMEMENFEARKFSIKRD